MEEDLLRWFRETLPPHKQVLLGPGDDAAVLKLAGGANLIATTDMLMDGTDFRLGEHDPALIGRKALASDRTIARSARHTTITVTVSTSCFPTA